MVCGAAEIERWSDQFKPKTASAATAVAALRTVHDARQYDKDLLPPSAFEAIFEKKPKGKATSKGKSAICCAWCSQATRARDDADRFCITCADVLSSPISRSETGHCGRYPRGRRCESADLEGATSGVLLVGQPSS